MGNYKINEYGEILREDYFFRQVHGTGVQILPFERKVWKIYLLTLVTLGIYGLILNFSMAKETNISCAEDGKHTMNFGGALLLSLITFGIFGLVWTCMWLNREANFLKRHGKSPKLTAGGFIGLFILLFVLNVLTQLGAYNPDLAIMGLIASIGSLIIGITFLTKFVRQHNEVNATYNEINNFVQKV